jgi:colicin import membrane protein
MSGRVYVMEGNGVQEPGAELEEHGAGKPLSAGLTDLLDTGPLFETALRGYDRLAVDGYVQTVEEELRSLRRQLHTVVERYHHCAAALVEARRQPEAQAEEILAEARAEAQARLSNVAALREAVTIARDEARRESAAAAAIREEAEKMRRDAERIRQEVEAGPRTADTTHEQTGTSTALRLALLQAEMEELRRQRDEARDSLRGLTQQIEGALQSLTAVLPDDVSALAESPEPVAG